MLRWRKIEERKIPMDRISNVFEHIAGNIPHVTVNLRFLRYRVIPRFIKATPPHPQASTSYTSIS